MEDFFSNSLLLIILMRELAYFAPLYMKDELFTAYLFFFSSFEVSVFVKYILIFCFLFVNNILLTLRWMHVGLNFIYIFVSAYIC